MKRGRLPAAALLSVLAISCAAGPDTAGPSPSPARSADIKQAKLDIAYSFISDNSMHRPTSAALLRGALDGVRSRIAAGGGSGDVRTPDFSADIGTNLADFKLFAAAARMLATANPQLPADRLADAAIVGMIRADPDCHTYYVDAAGGFNASRPVTRQGTGPRIPAGGVAITTKPDQDGLEAKVLPNGIAYVTWHQFEMNATYSITAAVRAVLDRSLAAGAKAWLFDLRGNIGGKGADSMSAWFLDGDATLRVTTRTGDPVTLSANRDLRLGAAYQLPIAIILNDQSASSPEVFAAALKENKRATIVGGRSMGCVGSEADAPLGADGSRLYVVIQEFVGAVTGTRYNGVGITPDVAADDASAVAAATAVLLAKIGVP